MSDPKPLASLSSGLLARKGAAKPAMRRQGISGLTPPTEAELSSMQEDLGWNDMGYDVDPDPNRGNGQEKPANPLMGAVPEVVRQRDDLAERLKASDSVANGAARDTHSQDANNLFSKSNGKAPIDLDMPVEEVHDESPTRDDHVQALQSDTNANAYDYNDDEDNDDVGLGSFAANSDSDSATGAPINVANSPLSVKKSAGTQFNWTEADTESDEIYEEEEKAETLAPQPEPNPVQTPVLNKPVHVPAPTKSVAKTPFKPVVKSGKRAAFTLRVDPERHLKLRLACAMHNVSAQQFVTQALDEYLDQIPEINEMAGKIPNNRGK